MDVLLRVIIFAHIDGAKLMSPWFYRGRIGLMGPCYFDNRRGRDACDHDK
jgi:hypothetical protein